MKWLNLIALIACIGNVIFATTTKSEMWFTVMGWSVATLFVLSNTLSAFIED